MADVGKTGFLMVALGFPVYLLWKGRLGTYIKLATTGGLATSIITGGSGATAAPVTIGGTGGVGAYKIGPMGIPVGSNPPGVNGLTGMPIPGL